MKILFVTQPGHENIPAVESSKITVNLLADELKKRKHEVIIFRTKKMFPKIKGKYDIVHGFSAAPILALRTYFLGLKLNAWKTIHTIKSESARFFGNKLFAFFLDFVDEVTFPTKTLKNKFQCKYGLIVKSNISLNKFKHKKTMKDIDVLYYGATWESKGIKELCKAVENTDIQTIIISRNPVPWELNKYFHLPNIKWMVGSIDNLEDYINRAKFVVLPYKTLKGTENTPSCLLEAVACKTPVITSNLPEIKEIFDNDEVLQVGPFYPNLWATIPYQLKHYKEAKKRAEKAYKKIKQFDTKEIAKQFEAIYNDRETN